MRLADTKARVAEAAVAFALTCALYLVGAGRSLDFDSSITVGNFVATPSLLDPFRRVEGLNNHPLFSFAEHVVYSLGGRGETALRVLPAVFGAATVALLAWWCARRFGLLAGAAAAAVTASNPMFASLSREVRGYSLLALSALAATIAFEALITRPTRRAEVVYVVSLAIGIGTHAYGALLLVLHAAWLLSRRELTRAWAARWAVATILGALAYVRLAGSMWSNRSGRGWHPRFPIELAQALLGTHALAVVAAALLAALAIGARWPPSRAAASVAAVMALLIAGIWLVAQPLFLYPRFFVWLVPGVGAIAALAVARWRVAAVLAAVCVSSAAIYESADWSKADLPTRDAGRIVRLTDAHGLHACSLSFDGEALSAYAPPPRDVRTRSQLTGCDVAVEYEGRGPTAQTRAELPYHLVLDDARTTFQIDSRVPFADLGVHVPTRR